MREPRGPNPNATVDDEGSQLSAALKVRILDQKKPRTNIPVSLQVGELCLVRDGPLPVEKRVRCGLTLAPQSEFMVTGQVLWCKRIYSGLWEVGLSLDENPKLVALVEACQEQWNAAPEKAEKPPTLEEMSQGDVERLAAITEVCEVFNSSFSTQEVLQRAMDVLLEATGAERCLLLIDRGHDLMEIPAACGDSNLDNKNYSHTVVNQVRTTGLPVLSRDVVADPRFQDVESLGRMFVRSILCVPVQTSERDFGLIYLDNRIKAGVFGEKELQLATLIAGLAASSLRRAEMTALMIQGEKMAALGTLLTGTVHELSNPLSAILSLSELLHLDQADELTESLVSEARRCKGLVNQLLDTARAESASSLHSLALEDVVEHTLRVVQGEVERHSIEVLYQEPETLSEIRGNAERISQVLLNLLFNAIYQVKDLPRGVVEIRLFERNGQVQVVVADNGAGIPEEDMARILDPFFTTKPPGEGTGMGLAVTHRLVKEFGGELWFENRADGGALFTVAFPSTELSGAGAPEEEAS